MASMMLFVVLVLSIFQPAINAFTLSNTINSHMVLHAEPQSARLYGFAKSGTVITAVLSNAQSSDQPLDDSTTYQTFTGSDGRWFIDLDPQPISMDRTIDISGSDGTPSIHLTDVSFGHVYLCGGQSNMMFTVSESFDGPEAVNHSAEQTMLRLFSVAEILSHDVTDDVQSNFADGSLWVRPNATYVGGPLWSYFSAVW